MRLEEIALGHLKRRKGKAILCVLGLALGVAVFTAMTVILQVMEREVAESIDRYGANILVVPRSEDLSLTYGGISVGGVTYRVRDLPEGAVRAIWSIKNAESLSAVAPKLLGAVEVKGRRVLLVGVLFDQELRMKPWWELEGHRPAQPEEVLVGWRVAEGLGLRPGSELIVQGRLLRVAAVLRETGSTEDDLIYAGLALVQELLHQRGRLSLIEVSALCTSCPIEEIAQQIAAALPDAKVTPLRQAVKGREATVQRLAGFALVISAVVVLVGALMTAVTMISSVNERTREIGILRAIGYRKVHVMRLILVEAVAIGAAGGALGYLG
ncbi:MAG: ABC transporter permease, partial [Bacillota bacterium]|nr:ABC transporter permease [Bacillota bacterium]